MNTYIYIKSRLSRFLAIALTALVMSGSVSSNLQASTGGVNSEFAAGLGLAAILVAGGLVDWSWRQPRELIRSPRTGLMENRAVPRSPWGKVGVGFYILAKTGLVAWQLSNVLAEEDRSGLNKVLWTAGLVAYWGVGLGMAID
jgi:hypothetical protein